MTLHDFLNSYGDVDENENFYGGNHCISIDGYCEECDQREVMMAKWYNAIKNKHIKRWQTIGGGAYKIEICIDLVD